MVTRQCLSGKPKMYSWDRRVSKSPLCRLSPSTPEWLKWVERVSRHFREAVIPARGRCLLVKNGRTAAVRSGTAAQAAGALWPFRPTTRRPGIPSGRPVYNLQPTSTVRRPAWRRKPAVHQDEVKVASSAKAASQADCSICPVFCAYRSTCQLTGTPLATRRVERDVRPLCGAMGQRLSIHVSQE
jgi:hypothetical protein